jgi:hypothetical protein
MTTAYLAGELERDDGAQAVAEQQVWEVEQRLDGVSKGVDQVGDTGERRLLEPPPPPGRLHGTEIDPRRQRSGPRAIDGRAAAGVGEAEKPHPCLRPRLRLK